MSLIELKPIQMIWQFEHLTRNSFINYCNCQYSGLNSTNNHNRIDYRLLLEVIKFYKLENKCQKSIDKNNEIVEHLIKDELVRKIIEDQDAKQQKYDGGCKCIKYRTLPKEKYQFRDNNVCNVMSHHNKILADIVDSHIRYLNRIGMHNMYKKIKEQQNNPVTFFISAHLGDMTFNYLP